jgi:hypothetical protein
MSRAPQRRPNKAITQQQQQTALMQVLVMRETLPTDLDSLARSFGLHVDLVKAMVANEALRRKLRA